MCQCPGCDEMSCGLPDCDECKADQFLTTIPGTRVELRADGVHFIDPEGTNA